MGSEDQEALTIEEATKLKVGDWVYCCPFGNVQVVSDRGEGTPYYAGTDSVIIIRRDGGGWPNNHHLFGRHKAWYVARRTCSLVSSQGAVATTPTPPSSTLCTCPWDQVLHFGCQVEGHT